MENFDPNILKKLYIPSSSSHKGQNGKLMIIGGSHLFHGASLWSLKVASRIVDMVFYSSVGENMRIAEKLKSELFDFILVPRGKIDEYINESDCVLIGPGLPRFEGQEEADDDTKTLTESLLKKYPKKKWVIDGGSLQTIDPEVLLGLEQMPILTPHQREFEILKSRIKNQELRIKVENISLEEQVEVFAREYNCVVLLKGEKDIVSSPTETVVISGGNAGMTKGGTGDVLAGLVAALYSKNDAFVSACAASYINKKTGESLFQRVGIYFNASDLADEIPKVMRELVV